MQANLECSFKKVFLKNTTILYVESDSRIRMEAFEILDGFFSKVILASDGKEALEKFSTYSREIDVILMDLDLPHMSGLELLKNIRKQNWDIPVLITTAFEQSELLLKLIKLNITNYIAKPMQLNTTFKIISLLMEEKQRKEDIKRHEYELKQMMSILDSINLVCEIDLNGFITYANDLYVMTSEYSLDELSKMRHKMIEPEDSGFKNFDEMKETITRGEVWSGERKKSTKSGKTYFTFSIILPILSSKGKILKYIEFATLTTKYKSEILKLKKHIISMKTNSFKSEQVSKHMKHEYDELAKKYHEKEMGYSKLVLEYQKRIDDGVDSAQKTLWELDKSKKRIAELEDKLIEQEKRFEKFQSFHMEEVQKLSSCNSST